MHERHGSESRGVEGRRRGRAGQGGCTRAAPGGCLVGERSLFGQQLRQGHPAVARPCRRRSRSEAQSRGSRGAPAGPYAVSADTGARARGRQCRAGACVPTDVARRAAIKAGSQKLDHEHGLRTKGALCPRTARAPRTAGQHGQEEGVQGRADPAPGERPQRARARSIGARARARAAGLAQCARARSAAWAGSRAVHGAPRARRVWADALPSPRLVCARRLARRRARGTAMAVAGAAAARPSRRPRGSGRGRRRCVCVCAACLCV